MLFGAFTDLGICSLSMFYCKVCFFIPFLDMGVPVFCLFRNFVCCVFPDMG